MTKLRVMLLATSIAGSLVTAAHAGRPDPAQQWSNTCTPLIADFANYVEGKPSIYHWEAFDNAIRWNTETEESDEAELRAAPVRHMHLICAHSMIDYINSYHDPENKLLSHVPRRAPGAHFYDWSDYVITRHLPYNDHA